MIEQTISIERMEEIVNLFGSFDENIRLLEQEYQVSIVCRDDHLKICGEPDGVLGAQNAITELLRLAAKGEQITHVQLDYRPLRQTLYQSTFSYQLPSLDGCRQRLGR